MVATGDDDGGFRQQLRRWCEISGEHHSLLQRLHTKLTAPLRSPHLEQQNKKKYCEKCTFLSAAALSSAAAPSCLSAASPSSAPTSSLAVTMAPTTADPMDHLPTGLKLFVRNLQSLTPAKLDDSNYPSWSATIRANLMAHRLLGYVDGTEPAPPSLLLDEKAVTSGKEDPPVMKANPAYETWLIVDAQIRACLLAIVSHTVQTHIHSLPTSAAIWTHLEQRHQLYNYCGRTLRFGTTVPIKCYSRALVSVGGTKREGSSMQKAIVVVPFAMIISNAYSLLVANLAIFLHVRAEADNLNEEDTATTGYLSFTLESILQEYFKASDIKGFLISGAMSGTKRILRSNGNETEKTKKPVGTLSLENGKGGGSYQSTVHLLQHLTQQGSS
ncbi:unnamed protein product [Cuscuta campestris]|uniref:Retrotransposon Copia-like N-terminal domain-containing protein n=1 Tax=Cuscuta campestris TaxID=132261 RepID=A0A484L0W2_9ASTE|nr:unnamed protein product [Cuscuta campestris]